MKRGAFLLVGPSLTLCVPLVVAQDAISPGVGDRVRIGIAAESAPPEGPADLGRRVVVAGTLVGVTDETLTLELDGSGRALGVARRSIVKLEASRGKRSRGKTALMGAGIGAGIALAGIALAEDQGKGYAVAGLVVGVPVWALIGAALPTPERWKEVPADRVLLGVGPLRGRGVAVSLNVAF
jgi:hypothetical protein